MNRLITFLGTGNYSETHYILDETVVFSRFASLALAEIRHFDRIDVFLTEAAANHPNWFEFRSEAKKLSNIHDHRIPDGSSEAELWEIFRTICGVVDKGDAVTLDITHGFRSLSAFATTIAQFLESARQATIGGLYYGAYEARDKESNQTPFFNLSSLTSLMRWTLATESFERTRNLGELARLLEARHRDAHSRNAAIEGPKLLQKRAKHLRRISDAWINMRAVELDAHNQNLGSALDGDFATEASTWAAPFHEILQQIRESFADYSGLSLSQLQRKLVDDYAANGNLLQAVTLAREWLISKVAETIGCPAVAAPPYPQRKPFESFLTSFTKSRLGETPHITHFGIHGFRDLESLDFELAHLWDRLSDLRNDLDHCGFRENARTTDALHKQAKTVLASLP